MRRERRRGRKEEVRTERRSREQGARRDYGRVKKGTRITITLIPERQSKLSRGKSMERQLVIQKVRLRPQYIKSSLRIIGV